MDRNNMTNDPFEEFEFKPINEGLGFHRKSKQNNQASSTSLVTPKAKSTTTSNLRSPIQFSTDATFIEKAAPSFNSPLPRTERTTKASLNIPSIEDDSIAVAQTAVNEILKNLNQKRQLDMASETEKQRTALRKSKPVLMATVLDAMLIVAAFLMSMIAMLSVTKTDLFLNLSHPETSRFIYISTVMLFLAVTFIYMVVNRAFLGYTPGEWAFDQRCGEEQDMNSLTYIPRISLRALLTIATGFITLPIASYLMNKDIVGELVGVTLLRKPNS